MCIYTHTQRNTCNFVLYLLDSIYIKHTHSSSGNYKQWYWTSDFSFTGASDASARQLEGLSHTFSPICSLYAVLSSLWLESFLEILEILLGKTSGAYSVWCFLSPAHAFSNMGATCFSKAHLRASPTSFL